jgi:4-amino-4-deoxy-L-arabinose transferase-like glycosyltransferase
MPWSLYLVAFFAAGVAALQRRALKLGDVEWRLILWAIMPLVFYTLSVGKQPRYILPVLPPLAVLVARGLIERIELDRTRRGASLSAATWISAAVYVVLALLFIRMEPVMINAYPVATRIAVGLIGCSAVSLAVVAMTAQWRHLPLVAAVAGVVVLVSVQFGALAGSRPEAVEQLATLIRANRSANEEIGVLDVFARNLPFYTQAPRTQIFDVEQAGYFVQSPQRVLLVVRTSDVPAIEKASGHRLKRLGETLYLNTANIRLRTLMRPDPTREIEQISLVSNR